MKFWWSSRIARNVVVVVGAKTRQANSIDLAQRQHKRPTARVCHLGRQRGAQIPASGQRWKHLHARRATKQTNEQQLARPRTLVGSAPGWLDGWPTTGASRQWQRPRPRQSTRSTRAPLSDDYTLRPASLARLFVSLICLANHDDRLGGRHKCCMKGKVHQDYMQNTRHTNTK